MPNNAELNRFGMRGILGAARQDRESHGLENPEYDVERSGEEYQAILFGLKNFFNYIRTLKESNKVLDLGAGNTRGISEIANSELGKDLDFYGLGLTEFPEVADYLGKEKFIKNSAEKMRDIKDSSVAGIISSFGATTHSLAPELVAEEADRVLVPGGVIKYTVRYKEEQDKYFAALYTQLFADKGYDAITFVPDNILKLPTEKQLNYVVGLAVKGGEKGIADRIFKPDAIYALRQFDYQKGAQ
jgi:SAM-dependent methyltransferase